MERITKEEIEFYSIFPAVQYLRARQVEPEYPPPGRGEAVPFFEPKEAVYPKGYLIDHELSSEDGHHTILYNDNKKEVVYSIKGTRWGDWGDLLSDVLILTSILLLKLYNVYSPIVRNDIYDKTQKIIKKYKIEKKYKLIFSSHSLGASLQQILLMHNYKTSGNEKVHLRFRDLELEKSLTYTDVDSQLNIFDYVDKVYAFDPGVGIMDVILSNYITLYITGEQREKLKTINNIFYVPFKLEHLYQGDPTALITDRLGLERLFIGTIHQHEKKLKYWAHSIYNYVNDNIIKEIDIDEQFIDKMFNNLSRIELFDVVKNESKIIAGRINRIMNKKDVLIVPMEDPIDSKTLLNQKRFYFGYYDINSPNYNTSDIKLHNNDFRDPWFYKHAIKDKLLTSDKPDNISNEEWSMLKNKTFEIRPSNFNYTLDDIRLLAQNKTHLMNELIEKNKNPLLVYTVKTNIDMEKGKGKAKQTVEVGSSSRQDGQKDGLTRLKELAEDMRTRPSYSSKKVNPFEHPMTILNVPNPQVGSPQSSFSNFGSSSRGASKGSSNKSSSKGSSSKGASTFYYEDLGGNEYGTSTMASIYGDAFEDLAPPDVYARYTASYHHPIGRGRFAPETETVTKALFDANGKPILGLDGKPIVTKEKVTKTRNKRSVNPIVKGGEPKKAPAIPKIVKPKPKVDKTKASTTKPKPISKKASAVPTVPKPKKDMKDKTIVKKTKTKVDAVYKM